MHDALTHCDAPPPHLASTHTIGPWGEPRHAAGGRLGEPTTPASGRWRPSNKPTRRPQQQRTSARHVPSSRHRLTGARARGRLRIRARPILDCMCCDVPQPKSTPHTTAGNACRWARRCGLVMESLTHKTADPSPSTRTTTACAPPASRIFVDIASIRSPLSVSQSITCSGNPASSIPTSLSTRWRAIDDGLGADGSTPSQATHLACRTAPKAFALGHGFYQQRGSLPTTLRGHTTMTETRRHRQP